MRVPTLLPTLAGIDLLALACAAPGKDDGDDPFDGADADADTDAETDADTEPATYSPVLIDFDDLPGEIDVAEEYADSVVFEVEEPYALYSWNYASYSRSEPYSAYTASSAGGTGVKADITFRFAAPVRNLEFYTLGDQTNGPFAYVDIETESGDEGTERLVGDGGASSAERCDLSAYDDIVSITIRDIEDAYTVNLDDISFDIRD